MALAVGGALMVITSLGQRHQLATPQQFAGVFGGAAFIAWGAGQRRVLRLSLRRLAALGQMLGRFAGRRYAACLRWHRPVVSTTVAARRPPVSGQPVLVASATPRS
jgi:hypothetical protein